MEQWKAYGNIQVSNYGNVHTKKGVHKGNKHTHGYRQCNVVIGGVNKRRYIHRLVAELFIENTMNKKVVNHIDGNKENNHVDNLEWCTLKENSRHAFDTGLANNEFLKEVNSKKCSVFDKVSKVWYTFNSTKEASEYFGHNSAYMSHRINRDGGENNKYIVKFGGKV